MPAKFAGRRKSRALSAHEAAKFSKHEHGAQPAIDSAQHQESESPLSIREEEILAYMADGKTDEKIAAEAKITLSTVESHTENIFKGLDVHSRAAAIVWYYKRKLARFEKRFWQQNREIAKLKRQLKRSAKV
jgi:DNA-binding NarL/FixJ family response regulator